MSSRLLVVVISLIAAPSWGVGLLPGDILALGTSDAGSGIIHVDPETHAQTLVSPHSDARFSDFTVASNGELFALVGDSVVQIDPSSGARTVVSAGGILSAPTAIAAAGGDDLFVVDGEPVIAGSPTLARIVRVDRKTGAQSVLLESAHLDFYHDFNDMIYTGDGRLIVNDSCTGALQCVGAASQIQSFNADIVSVDPDSGMETLIYRSSVTNPGLSQFKGDGKGSTTAEILLSTGAYSFSEGLGALDLELLEFDYLFGGFLDVVDDASSDEAGRVIAARYDGTSGVGPFVPQLVRFTRETAEFELLALGAFSEVELVPATAIPEPGSGILLAVGFGLLAAARRRALSP
jgi:hypothetical protein